ncbi:MAG: ectonucleotide pyrophosphatase/phosphodiesterase [Clostridium sp.]|uniref:alkaline phosphatase family protein n=1 Tax=Clostridium sp. TaxID=1506 RepID=UPI003F2DE764
MNKKFIILSFDAVSSEDFNSLKKLSSFEELIKESSYSSDVSSVYPSLTYPAHTSICTGKLPINHGIINNILIQPERKSPDWFWNRKYINGTTIYDIAKKNGLRTCTLLWPVTGKAKTIDLNLPEVFPNRKFQNQIMVSALNGSPLFQLKVEKLYGHLRQGFDQPYLDNFVFSSLMYVLENDLADFIMVHLTDTDTHKHNFGTKNPHIFHSLKRHNNRLSQIINFLKENNIYEDSTIICLGDHSFKDADFVIKLNKFFIDNNLITLDSKGNIKDYIAYMNFCDGSAYVYVKDEEFVKPIYTLISNFSKENNNCIKSILSSKEASLLGASDKCTFMLEASDNYYFINDLTSPIIEETKGIHPVANHGYNPFDSSYKTFFTCKNPSVKKAFNIGEMSLIDEGATIFKLLNHIEPNIDGAVLDIFSE